MTAPSPLVSIPSNAQARRTFSDISASSKFRGAEAQLERSDPENGQRRSASLGRLWHRKRPTQLVEHVEASSAPSSKDGGKEKDDYIDDPPTDIVVPGGPNRDLGEEGEDVFPLDQTTVSIVSSHAKLTKQKSFSSQTSSASDSSQTGRSDSSKSPWGPFSRGRKPAVLDASQPTEHGEPPKNGSPKHGLRLALSKLRSAKQRSSSTEPSKTAQSASPMESGSLRSPGFSPTEGSPIDISSPDLPLPPPSIGSIRSKASSTYTSNRSSTEFPTSPARSPSKYSLVSRSLSGSKANSFILGPSSRRLSSAAGEQVKETHVIVRDYDPNTGNKIINKYMILKELGRGCHGKVKLCVDLETGEQWALKIVPKKARPRFQSRLLSHRLANGRSGSHNNPELEKIKREIAILKKCAHPHVVSLKEVIDDPGSEKIYLVLEYLAGGDIRWHDGSMPPKPILSVEQARRIFRDVVCGVEYLHYQGIVHRDIKPANLLWTSDGRVKISDFGVSVVIRRKSENGDTSEDQERSNDLELAKTAGTPAFFAPEMCGISDDDHEHWGHDVDKPFNAFGSVISDNRSHNTDTPATSTSPGTPRRGLSNQSSFAQSDAVATHGATTTPATPSRDISSGDVTERSSSTAPVPIPFRKSSARSDFSTGSEPLRQADNSSTPFPVLSHGVSSPPTSPTLSPHSAPAHSQDLPIGKAIDIWAMGVTLYCFVFGRVPFMAETEFELFNVISKKPLEFPPDIPITDDLRDLFYRLLDKDPNRRITLEEIKVHPWATADMSSEEREAWLLATDPTIQYGAPVQVTDEDVRGAVTIMTRIRDRIRKLSSSFQNLTAGLRRRTKSMPSVPSDTVEALVEQANASTHKEMAGTRQSTAGTTGHATSRVLRGRRKSPLSGGESSSDSLNVKDGGSPVLSDTDVQSKNELGTEQGRRQEWFRWEPGQSIGLEIGGHRSKGSYVTEDEGEYDGIMAERERLKQFHMAYAVLEDDIDGEEGEEEEDGGLRMRAAIEKGERVIIDDNAEDAEAHVSSDELVMDSMKEP